MSPRYEGMTRLVARRIGDGLSRSETPREIADAVLAMLERTPSTVDPSAVMEVVADLNQVAALAPAVAAIVDAAEQAARLEILHRAADELRQQAGLRFDERGGEDIRGGALWDAATHLDPDDGDALAVGKRKGELAPGGVVGGPPSPDVSLTVGEEECVLDRGGRCLRNDQRHLEITHGEQR